jgi:membrane protein DedA with SNARE-associated domain
MLKKYGMRLLIVARFIPGGRTAVTITAGVTNYDRRRFVIAVAVAAVLWTGYAFGIGLVGGRTFENNTFAAFGLAFAVAAAASLLIEVSRRLFERSRRSREPSATQARHRS